MPNPGRKYGTQPFVLGYAIAYTEADADIPYKNIKGVSVNTDGNLVMRFLSEDGQLSVAVTMAAKAGIIYPISPKQITTGSTDSIGITLWF